MKYFNLLTILLMVGLSLSQTQDISKIKCTNCRCYQLKCSRLENYDPTCVDTYRDTCDNNEDITEENFCNTQCDCCLQNQCFVWQNYECMIFRTYEFSNIVYFILITVNAFILTRLYKAMFSREEDRRLDEPEEDEEEKKLKAANSEITSVKFMGRLAIKKDLRALKRLQEDTANIISDFFDEVDKHKAVASKNQMILASMCLLYLLLNAFHAVNIFVMSGLPLTYVYVIWIQHLMLIAFWVSITLVFKKATLYIVKVRETIKAFEEAKKCKITLHAKGNLIDFNFNPEH
jgi:hypothetical protein